MASSHTYNTTKRNPALSMQLYLESDLRRQCIQSVNDSNSNSKKIAGLVGLKKSNSASMGLNTVASSRATMLGGWSTSHSNASPKYYSNAPMNNTSSWITGTSSAQQQPPPPLLRRKSLWFHSTPNTNNKNNSSMAPSSRHLKSHSMGSDSTASSNASSTNATTITRRSSKYDGLTLAQKVEIIVNDDIQWLKLQQSLRDHAEGLWTSLAIQQVLHTYVQQRIDEMEQLEYALNEPNGPPSATDATSTESAATATAEDVGVVSAVRKFARRASLATQSYLASQNPK